LTGAESMSLVKTWTPEFFETPGVRVITLLPPWIYEAALPLEIYPVPEETVRVGLVWAELDEHAGENGAKAEAPAEATAPAHAPEEEPPR